jgi:CoA-dependent NAD(P)H sulfur oxidoreductase
MRIAIIGGTATGPAAAAEAVRCNPEAEVVLYEQEPHISVGSCEIPYYLGAWIDDWRDLEILTPRQFEATRGGTVRVRHRVLELRPRQRQLVVEALDYGSVHEERFDRVILCTGALPRRLGIEGEDAPNVFHIRTLETARAIRQWVETEHVRHVVMVGAGYIGVEVAETLRSRGLRVTLLDPTGRTLSPLLCPEMGALVDEAARAHGVSVRKEVPIRFQRDRHGRVRAVHTDCREIIGCDLVLIAIGLLPDTTLAEAAGVALGRSGAIAVDEGMQTNLPNVWACGDNAEVPHVVTGKPVYLPLAPVARRAARVAARNAARRGGSRETIAPVTGILGVRAFGVEAVRAGLSEPEARAAGFDAVAAQVQHWSRTKIYPGSKPLYVRLIVERGTGRLLGGELAGQEGAGLRANTLVPLIREGYTAAQVVREVDLLYNPPMAPAVDPLLIACSAAAKAAETPVRARATG